MGLTRRKLVAEEDEVHALLVLQGSTGHCLPFPPGLTFLAPSAPSFNPFIVRSILS